MTIIAIKILKNSVGTYKALGGLTIYIYHLFANFLRWTSAQNYETWCMGLWDTV